MTPIPYVWHRVQAAQAIQGCLGQTAPPGATPGRGWPETSGFHAANRAQHFLNRASVTDKLTGPRTDRSWGVDDCYGHEGRQTGHLCLPGFRFRRQTANQCGAGNRRAALGGPSGDWWRRRELNPRPRMIQIQFYMRSRSIYFSPRAWPIGRPARSQSLDLDAAVMTPPASSFREWRCCRLPNLARKRTSAASGRY